MKHKYVFVTGVPGSKWSAIARRIYLYSFGVDTSDFSNEKTYYHDASGQQTLAHFGAYFDPGMEFGKEFREMNLISKKDLEEEFDRPFSSTDSDDVRIIKSHSFAYHLDFIKDTWPECPIVISEAPDDECLRWWIQCGGFDITYPDYSYYRDIDTMAQHITMQNSAIRRFIVDNDAMEIESGIQLLKYLGIESYDTNIQEYYKMNIKVYTYWSKYNG
jgi:hypothetical protein